ncbi:MAG: VTT domain-containing protein [Blastocatellia bacterium]
MGIFLALLFDVWRTLRRLGGIGLILMGVLDSSVIPTPGGLDALTIVLAAKEKELWFYYAAMAVIGSVLGGYLTYRLGRRSGEEALARRISKKRLERVHSAFERWGFGTVFIPSILPPPFPLSPFLLGAGAMNYPLKKYLVALAAGRAIRFTLIAYLASLYGRSMINLFAKHYVEILVGLIALAVIGSLIFVIYRSRRRRKDEQALDEA